MRPVQRILRSIQGHSLWQVAGSYLLSVWAAVQLTDTIASLLGLPDGFLRLVLGLLLCGLPFALLLTWFLGQKTPATSALHARVRAWRPALLAVLSALIMLTLSTTAWLGSRTMGLGPAGSLVAHGVLPETLTVVLSELEAAGADSALAQTATEALRIDLEQSRALRVVDAGVVRQALARMRRPDARLDVVTALELAQREGAAGVVAGSIGRLGRDYIVSVRLLVPRDGAVLLSLGETASSDDALVPVLGLLSRRLRERAGEPLRALGRAQPLEQLTTGSLDALRLYAQAKRALNVEGDVDRSITLSRQAIARDSLFALSYVTLGIALLNRPGETAAVRQALAHAFALRERLSGPERFLVEATYYDDVEHDSRAALAAYLSLHESYPGWKPTMVANNVALLYEEARDYPRAAAFYREALHSDSSTFVPFLNLAVAQYALGDRDSAAATLRAMAARHRGNPWMRVARSYLASAQEDYDAAQRELDVLRAEHAADAFWQEQTTAGLANLARVRGRLAEAEGHLRSLVELRAAAGDSAAALDAWLDLASLHVSQHGDPRAGLREAAAALQAFPLARLDAAARPYLSLAQLYAAAGNLPAARASLQAYENGAASAQVSEKQQRVQLARGWIALAAGDPLAAVARARLADAGACRLCALPLLGRAWEASRQPDSAIATYERYLATPSLFRIDEGDARWLALAHRSLAKLYEHRGDRPRARLHLARFIELWQDADPELRPQLERARTRRAQLAAYPAR